MVLSSQIPRTVSRGRYMTSSRRGRRGRGLLLLGAVVVVGIGGWLIWSNSGPTDEMAFDAGGDPVDQAAENAERSVASNDRKARAGSTRTEVPVREPEPPVLTLGQSSAQSPTSPGRGAGAATPPASASDRSSEAPTPTPPASDPISGDRVRSADATPRGTATGEMPGAGQPDGQPLRTAPVEQPVVRERTPSSGASTPPPIAGDGSTALQSALALVRRDPIEARRLLTAVAIDYTAPAAERARAREELNAISKTIFFSPLVLSDDPFVSTYTVQSGDTIQRIRNRESMDADWRLLMRINGIADERRVRVGQTLKLIRGAFHATVSKSEYRMDVFLGESSDRVMVASFPVGLGEYNSTPTGRFRVRPNSRLINPAWVNPRTGERFTADDPLNPIGERWIGLQGIDLGNSEIDGYGIHGTIEPGSIGRQASMGCVRMLGSDVEVIYELLTEPNSTVTIVD